MLPSLIFTAVLGLLPVVNGQCGSGSPNAVVSGSSGSYRATHGSIQVYSGGDYYRAITSALGAIGSGERVAVMASGSIGTNVITIDSGKIFEGCGTIDVGNKNGRGSIETKHTTDAEIRYLKMTGSPYFGMLFYGTRGLKLGEITMDLSSGMGIRFHRDEDWNYDVTMGTIRVTGASSHAVETWNIDGLKIDSVIARNVGECGLLLQRVTNARVALVDGTNVATGTGYATFRMANQNGMLPGGSYAHNVFVDKVISRGGGRGIFCVSQSGGAVIRNIDLASNGNNAILIENCYGVEIQSGTVDGGGEVRVAARDEFANTRDVSISLDVRNTSVRESPCGSNVRWYLSGNARTDVCSSVGDPADPPEPSPTTPGGGGGDGCAPRWGQCGGSGWGGPKCCEGGLTCTAANQWYSQCL